MQSARERYVVVGILAMALLTAITLNHGLQWLWVYTGWDNPYLFSVRALTLTTLLAYGTAVAAAVFCFRHKPTYQLCLEVVEELSKVTWPSREETGNATVVVIITVLICSAYLGAFDAVWLWLTNLILGVGHAAATG